MAAESACVLVVDDLTDSLAANVAGELRRHGVPVRHVLARTLGLLDLHVDRDEVLIDGAQLAAVFFRAGPWTQYAEGFRADDIGFASMEVSATWLAITARPTIVAVNRPDAELWTTRAEWAVWRRRLLAAGVPCVDLDVGAVDGPYSHWLPWGGGGVAQPPGSHSRRLFASALTNATSPRSAVWFAGRTFPDLPHPPELADFFGRHGIALAGISTDDHGRIALCTAHPQVDEPTARIVAPLIAERLVQRVAVA